MAKDKAKAKTKTKTKTKTKKFNIARPSTFSDERFRVEGAADTMMRMQEINSDPKLKVKADKELARRAKAIARARKA